MSEPRYSIVVMDTDQLRHRPLACHTGLTFREAFELAAVYAALGHRGQDVAVSAGAAEAAQPQITMPARRAS